MNNTLKAPVKTDLTGPLKKAPAKKQGILQEIKDIYHYHQRSTKEFAIHDYNNVYKKAIRDLEQMGLDSIEGKELLDLGCGARFPFSLLAASEGARVTALDISYVEPHILPLFFWNILKANGLKRAAKSVLRKILFDKLYQKELSRNAGVDLTPYVPKIKFILADPAAADYQLPSGKYDLIASNAVLEHVDDTKKYFREVSRLLRKGGLFYGLIHNYYSISGGHNLENAFPDSNPSKRVQPWDHLRSNEYPTHIYLNKLKPSEYKADAGAALEVLLFEGRDINHDPGGREGEKLLTPQVKSELSMYSKDLLLTRSYCIICKKL